VLQKALQADADLNPAFIDCQPSSELASTSTCFVIVRELVVANDINFIDRVI